MPEGPNTALARRIAPKDRPPTAMELWLQRYFRACDRLSAEQRKRHAALIRDIASVLGHQDDPSDPHYRDSSRYREIWSEIGELVGVGPLPAGSGFSVPFEAERPLPGKPLR